MGNGQSASLAIEGDQPIKLGPPLRPSLWRIRFSPDGRYVLAQDEAAISVADRVAGKLLFRIDAPDVEAAQFSPDSSRAVFHDSKLRVEQWSVSDGRRISVQELVIFDGCGQTLLSPDARTLICASLQFGDQSPHLRLRLVDVDSGKILYDKPKFYDPGLMTQTNQLIRLARESITGTNPASMVMSPDGRYLLVAGGTSVWHMTWNIGRRWSLGESSWIFNKAA